MVRPNVLSVHQLAHCSLYFFHRGLGLEQYVLWDLFDDIDDRVEYRKRGCTQKRFKRSILYLCGFPLDHGSEKFVGDLLTQKIMKASVSAACATHTVGSAQRGFGEDAGDNLDFVLFPRCSNHNAAVGRIICVSWAFRPRFCCCCGTPISRG